MNEPCLARMKGDATIGIGTRRAVLQVALDGQTDVGELTTYLMVTPRKELNLKQRIAVGGGYHTIMQTRLLGTLTRFTVGVGTVLLLVADQIIGQVLFLRRQIDSRSCRIFTRSPDVLDDAPIGLVDFTTRKHPVETFESFAGLGKKDDPGSGTIQPMGDTQKDIARLGVTLLDKALQRVGQRLVARLVGLHNLVAGLADGDDMVIFVDDLHLTNNFNC